MSAPLEFIHPMIEGEVSVILIAKDAARFLTQAIGSVLAQRRPPLEILLVLGDSTDDTAEIAASFPAVTLIHQRGQGIADAWNCGIVHARGELLAFLSADDIWTADKLLVQGARMLAEPQLLYSIAHFRYVLEPGHPWPRGLKEDLRDRHLVGRIMETLVARRQLFARLGGFDSALSTAEDVDFFLRAQEKSIPMAVLAESLLIKRLHDKNASSCAKTNTKNLFTALRRSISRREDANEADR